MEIFWASFAPSRRRTSRVVHSNAQGGTTGSERGNAPDSAVIGCCIDWDTFVLEQVALVILNDVFICNANLVV